ncbi:hypothetical protein B0T19DRAFT_83150 [Cercophora scortea]|uniref:Uncharacterized protein n=1 Tax=Cercophora scortea TaxID=314031 RepID=A0AAE0IVY9_9PEZI|nr:hypothetical protein B0T19DRAFT_83150 [Cercophora scortea]
MTLRADTPPTTAPSQYVLIDFLDIVATQGAYLAPRAHTPVFPEPHDGQFAAKLKRQLELVILQQIWRRARYHDAADEWPMGHTPPEVKEKREAELKAWDELAGVTSDGSSDSEGDDKDKDNRDDVDAKVGLKNPKDAIPSTALKKGRKWRRILNAGNEEEGKEER